MFNTPKANLFTTIMNPSSQPKNFLFSKINQFKKGNIYPLCDFNIIL